MVAEDMSPVVTYEYDAWGKLLNVGGEKKDTVGKLNPFRYRGYVYEEESGLYYVSSRYYDPEVGRFLNADDYEILFEDQDNILENNLYTYCFNNPANYEDSNGYAGVMVLRIGARITLKGLGTTLLSLASSITPAGWVVIGAVVIGGVVYARTKSKGKSKSEVDPYRRPGQKKQNRETKNKSRQSEDFTPRNNKRNKKPAKPKSHTPSKRGHRKYR